MTYRALMLVAALCAGCPENNDDGSAGAGGAPSAPAWQAVLDDGKLDRALLSGWASSPKDVYAVGGPLGNAGFDALVLHFNGEAWRTLPAGGTASFWWVHGSGPNDVWLVGEQGRITHYDGASFVEHTSNVTATLWGVYAFAPNDVWAVGGTPGMAGPDDIVLRYDGSSWQPVMLPAPLNRSLFKIWGTSSDDMYIVGEGGVILHRTPSGFVDESSALTQATLFTVHGCSADEVYAVGGRDVLKRSGGVWSKVSVELFNQVNGVFCVKPGELAIVGGGGLKQRQTAGVWADDFGIAPNGDLHAVFGDGSGALWAVGGNFLTQPKPNVARNGIVARYGSGKVSAELD